MTNKRDVSKEPAFPQGMPEHGSHSGLTKREYFALHIFQGIIQFDLTSTNREKIIWSIQAADQLLEKLEK